MNDFTFVASPDYVTLIRFEAASCSWVFAGVEWTEAERAVLGLKMTGKIFAGLSFSH